MTTHDGTQERTLDPPDLSLSDAEMRACERAAREGFDAMDERADLWLDEQLADTPMEVAYLTRRAIDEADRLGRQSHVADAVALLRARYIAECAEDYAAELAEQEKYAQEP